MRSTLSARRIAAALSVATLLVSGAACSTSGGDAADTTTTEPSTDPSTGGGDGSTTTLDEGGGDASTTSTTEGGASGTDELEALLPTVSSLPLDYDLVTDEDDDPEDEGDDAFDEDMKRACPDAYALLDEDDEDDDGEVSRAFATKSQQEIEVKIAPAKDDEVSADDVIEAINSCAVVETELDGSPAVIELSADQLDLGDEGLQMEMLISFEYEGTSVEIFFTGFEFRRDGIAVEVSASSGFDDDLTSVPGHPDVAYGLAATIDETIVG